MFTPHNNKAVGFESSWKTEQKLTFSETQTDEITSTDSACQVLETTETAVQTDVIEFPEVSTEETLKPSLLAFLQRVTPKVLEELDRQQRSSAFEGYGLIDDDSNTKATLLHTLRWPALFSEGTVTCLSWSSTGAVIAVAYGADTHDNWCQHRSAVALWNVNRCESVSLTPEKVLDVSSCVHAVSFHPTNPAIVALATRTGEVHVYNLSDNDLAMATAYTGGSGVTCLQWRNGENGEELVASTQGGHVLFWTVNFNKQTVVLSAAVIILYEDLPRSSRVGAGLAEGREGVGVTSLSFNSEDKNVFVVGVEGGGVLLCSTIIQLPTRITVEGVACRRCVVSALSSHSGRLTTTASSPHHRNALISLASDNQLKLHSLIQTNEPVVTLHSDVPLTAVQWSPARAVLLATATSMGQVNLIDVCALQSSDKSLGSLKGSTHHTLLSLPQPEKPAPVSALAFNAANVSLISVGDTLGRVFVWRVPTEVMSANPKDLKRLADIISAESLE